MSHLTRTLWQIEDRAMMIRAKVEAGVAPPGKEEVLELARLVANLTSLVRRHLETDER